MFGAKMIINNIYSIHVDEYSNKVPIFYLKKKEEFTAVLILAVHNYTCTMETILKLATVLL